MNENSEMEAGTQPLDALMRAAELKNHDLVVASSVGLTHKQVAKARRGRRLTLRLQNRVLAAWNVARGEERKLEELFNYRGR